MSRLLIGISYEVKKAVYQRHTAFGVGGGGFEPPKQFAADLQSVPFGHSGIRPKPYLIIKAFYRKSKCFLEKNIGKIVDEFVKIC